MEYKIISDYSTEQIEFTVSHYLKEGWKLAGGINVIIYNNNVDYPKPEDHDLLLYTQAIYR